MKQFKICRNCGNSCGILRRKCPTSWCGGNRFDVADGAQIKAEQDRLSRLKKVADSLSSSEGGGVKDRRSE